MIGVGGILRDHRGNMIMAFSQNLGSGTSNLAEATAALLGLQWYHANGYDRIILECDSKLVIDMSSDNLKSL